MARVIDLPIPKDSLRYAKRLKTKGEHWIHLEKRLLDQAEFMEAMILVLEDVRVQNIRKRDFAMMDIVTEEIPRYKERLEEIKKSLTELRQDFDKENSQVAF